MDRATAEDFVIDMVLEVDSRGIDVDATARAISLPGVEILRTSRRGMIWLTALVTAEGEAEAIRSVQDSVLDEVSAGSQILVAASVTSAPLGDLCARLDSVLADDEIARMDLLDLVESTLWDRGDRVADLHVTQRLSTSA